MRGPARGQGRGHVGWGLGGVWIWGRGRMGVRWAGFGERAVAVCGVLLGLGSGEWGGRGREISGEDDAVIAWAAVVLYFSAGEA